VKLHLRASQSPRPYQGDSWERGSEALGLKITHARGFRITLGEIINFRESKELTPRGELCSNAGLRDESTGAENRHVCPKLGGEGTIWTGVEIARN